MKKTNISVIAFCSTLAVGLGVSSCADDDSLSRMSPSHSAVTLGVRSAGDEQANELINSYRIYFVAEDKSVAAIVDGAGTAAASHEFQVSLNPGNYKAYGFANINEESWDYWQLSAVGESMAWPSLTDAMLPPAASGGPFNGWGADRQIPMAGRGQDITVTGRENQSFAIEVERLLAALQFTFRNDTEAGYTVRDISFGPLTRSGENVRLIRRNAEDTPPQLAGSPATETYKYSLETPLSLPAGKEAAAPLGFYVLESDAKVHPSGHFVISLGLQRNGEPDVTEQRYALTQQIRYINRNDMIRIPIVLTDYVFEVPVWFYPPIGGYPPVDIEQKSDSEFYCTFRSGGDFVMRPRIRRSQDGPDGWIDLNDRKKVESDPLIEVSGDDIFVSGSQPRLTATGEILGTLDEAKNGTSVVTFTAKLKSEVEGAATRTLVRKIYIVKN